MDLQVHPTLLFIFIQKHYLCKIYKYLTIIFQVINYGEIFYGIKFDQFFNKLFYFFQALKIKNIGGVAQQQHQYSNVLTANFQISQHQKALFLKLTVNIAILDQKYHQFN
ncbi:unnamed protein product [Paramecium pentaurelia]|uniref:Uncharacterized protein n=1 Tax=Paramecium pentaurelia TaxID=43138 RepID=A0A8S1W7I5_9CILI|nr:unnamed protein product [Paramecium pentaurelia]